MPCRSNEKQAAAVQTATWGLAVMLSSITLSKTIWSLPYLPSQPSITTVKSPQNPIPLGGSGISSPLAPGQEGQDEGEREGKDEKVLRVRLSEVTESLLSHAAPLVREAARGVLLEQEKLWPDASIYIYIYISFFVSVSSVSDLDLL